MILVKWKKGEHSPGILQSDPVAGALLLFPTFIIKKTHACRNVL